MERTFRIDHCERALRIERKGNKFAVTIDGKTYEVTYATLTDGVLSFFMGDHTYRAYVSKNVLGTQISLSGRDYVVHGQPDEDEGAVGGAHHGDGTIEAPMPGSVVSVNVAVGDKVSVGDSIVIVESMKMQNDITAAVSGTVTAVGCAVGDQVSFGQVLAEIEPDS